MQWRLWLVRRLCALDEALAHKLEIKHSRSSRRCKLNCRDAEKIFWIRSWYLRVVIAVGMIGLLIVTRSIVAMVGLMRLGHDLLCGKYDMPALACFNLVKIELHTLCPIRKIKYPSITWHGFHLIEKRRRGWHAGAPNASRAFATSDVLTVTLFFCLFVCLMASQG